MSYGPASLSLEQLGQRSIDRQFMRWRDVRNITVDEKKYTISLRGEGKRTLDLRCTSETFESALQLVREHEKPARS